MPSRVSKSGFFFLEGLNSCATVLYSYYLYFFMRQAYGFSDKANLCLAALNGFIYVFAAWWGGQFAQRFGYLKSLKLGFFIMFLAMVLGSQCHSALGQVLVMVTYIIGMCFTWPTLEA